MVYMSPNSHTNLVVFFFKPMELIKQSPFTVHFSGSGDTRKGVCLRMSVAELMERIGVNEGYSKKSSTRGRG